MAGRGSGTQDDRDYGIEAFLASRARWFLCYRLTVRLVRLASPDGRVLTPGWRLLLLGFVGIDLLQWALLRNPERFALKTRLAVDSTDIAIWSLAPYPPSTRYELAVYIAFPLALEAGIRLRWRGLVVPAVTFAVAAVVRSLAGRPVQPLLALWLVLGVACGVTLRAYIDRLRQRSEKEWSQRRSAEHRRAFLAGQNSVAMGASSVVDAIEGILPALGPPEPGSVLWELANAWKPDLYRSTVGHAAYLGQVLGEWTADFNRHPDLSSRVELTTSEGVGTTLLTNDQEVRLRRTLAGLGLRGSLDVSLDDPSIPQRLPGGRIRLCVGPHVVELPADPDRPPRRYDPGPVAFLLAALLMLSDVLGGGFRVLALLPAMLLSVAAAVWAHLSLRNRGVSARPRILVVAVVVAVTYVVTAMRGLRVPLGPGGLEIHPVIAPLDLLALLGGMYWRWLRPPVRWIAPAGGGLVVAACWLLHPLAHHPAHLAIQAVWSLHVVVGALQLSRELDVGSARFARELMERDVGTEGAAFRRGQAMVVDLVRQARDEARQRLAEVRASLAPRVASSVEARLDEVDRRLVELEAEEPPEAQ